MYRYARRCQSDLPEKGIRRIRVSIAIHKQAHGVTDSVAPPINVATALRLVPKRRCRLHYHERNLYRTGDVEVVLTVNAANGMNGTPGNAHQKRRLRITRSLRNV